LSSVNEIERELQEINDYLAEPISDEPALLVERLNLLQGYLGRMPRILAQLKYNTLKAKERALSDPSVEGSPSVIKNIVEGMIAKEIALEHLADRTESAIQKSIEATRSVLSFLKQLTTE